MQKSRRMRKPETPRSAPNANGHTHSGPRSEETISQVTTGPTSSSPPPAPAPSATETAETLRIQQQEQRYINVMDAGARLLQVISLSDLKRELIKEGKELLQRYDTILIKYVCDSLVCSCLISPASAYSLAHFHPSLSPPFVFCSTLDAPGQNLVTDLSWARPLVYKVQITQSLSQKDGQPRHRLGTRP